MLRQFLGSSYPMTRQSSQTMQLLPSQAGMPQSSFRHTVSRPEHHSAGRICGRKKLLRASSVSVSLGPLKHEHQPQHGHLSSFEDLVQQSHLPVLVDFYAPWCGPCQLMSKVVSDISLEMQGDLRVMKINADRYPKLANKYRIQALPTCLLFRDGKLIDRVDGFMPEPGFGKRIRFYVARLDKKFGRR